MKHVFQFSKTTTKLLFSLPLSMRKLILKVNVFTPLKARLGNLAALKGS